MADVYRIGVSMALTNNVSSVLGVMARDMLGFRGEIGRTEAAMSRLKGLMVGAGAVLAGAAVLDGMKTLVEHGEKLVHQQALLKEAGFSQVDVAQATATAWKATSDVIGTTVADNVALLADLRNRLGDLPKAIASLPQIARIGVVLANGTGQDPEKAGDQAARFLELRGSLVNKKTEQIDPSQLAAEARLVEAIAASTRFKVGPDQLLSFQTTARAAGASLTDEGLKNLVPIIQAAKSPSNVGTQLSSLEQQLIGGIMTQAGAHFFERAGVLNPNMVHEGRGGHLTIDRGAVNDEKTLREDPATWIYTTLRNGLRKGFGDTTVDQQTTEIMRSHLRNTVVGLLVEAVRSEAAFKKDAGLIGTAEKTDQYQAGLQEDPTAKIKAFHDAWDNLLTSLGAPLVKPATDALVWVAREVNQATQFFAAHPDGARIIGEYTAAFAGLLVLGGSIKVMSIALGPFAAGMRALGGGLALFGPGATASAGLTTLAGGGLAGFARGIGLVALAVGAWYLAYSRIKGALDEQSISKSAANALIDSVSPNQTVLERVRLRQQNTQRDADHSAMTDAGRSPTSARLSPNDNRQPIVLNNYTIIDGKVVAKTVTQHMVAGLSSNAGPTTGDMRAAATPPGGTGSPQ